MKIADLVQRIEKLEQKLSKKPRGKHDPQHMRRMLLRRRCGWGRGRLHPETFERLHGRAPKRSDFATAQDWTRYRKNRKSG